MSIVSAASLCHPCECATLNVETACQPANEIDEAFQFFDANADGVLTTKEFSTMVRSQWWYNTSIIKYNPSIILGLV